MRRWLGLLVLALVAGSAQAQSAPPPANALRPAEVLPVPAELPGYRLVDTAMFAVAELGVRYRYHGPGDFDADVFVYPLRPLGRLCRGKCQEEMAKVELAEVREAMPVLIEQGYADSVIEHKESGVDPPKGSWVGKGRRLRLRMVNEGSSFDSHVLVFVGLETVIKFRVTGPPNTMVSTQVLDDFVRGVLLNAVPPYTCAAGYLDQPGIVVGMQGVTARRDMATAIDSAYARLGYTVAQRAGDYNEAAIWRSEPSFRWPGTSATESWHGSVNPGVMIFALVTLQQGQATSHLVSQVLCRPVKGGSKKGDEEVLRTLTAIEFTAEVARILGRSGR